jgi:hypothetical protein
VEFLLRLLEPAFGGWLPGQAVTTIPMVITARATKSRMNGKVLRRNRGVSGCVRGLGSRALRAVRRRANAAK